MKNTKHELSLLKNEVKFAEDTIKQNKLSAQKAFFFIVGLVSGFSLYGNLRKPWKLAFKKSKTAKDVIDFLYKYIEDNSK
jgi:hypothetical protein